MKDFNWNNISHNPEVIDLLKKMDEIERQIREIDINACVKYELEKLGLENDNESLGEQISRLYEKADINTIIESEFYRKGFIEGCSLQKIISEHELENKQ